MGWMTKQAIATQIALTGYVAGVVEHMRSDEREKGGVMVEYIGVILVVIAIIGALTGLLYTDVGNAIKGKIVEAVNSLTV